MLLVALLGFTLSATSSLAADSVEQLKVKILAVYPHDTSSFTQGLVFSGGCLYESTGQRGDSKLRQVRLADGKVIRERRLASRYFGEGLALAEGKLFQLTWTSGVAFIWNADTFEPVGQFSYEGQGWGLTFDGSWLVMSDGSNVLTFRDPKTFAVWRRLPVTLNGQPVENLNELEYVKGQIYANVWQATEIVRIDPSSGHVTAVIDASSLPYRPRIPGDDVLNGIAFDPQKDTFLLTGKLWPKIFEVRFY
ncbi:MAG: glutaminyl-peptide cyclotransferase [Acidobacteriota bacterium]